MDVHDAMQTLITLAGILAVVVASHQRLVHGLHRLDERIRDLSIAVSARLDHVEKELEEHGVQLHRHALSLDRVEQALMAGPMPLAVIQDRLTKLDGEVTRLREFRHGLENERHRASLAEAAIKRGLRKEDDDGR